MQLLLPCFVVCLSQAHCIRKRKSCGSVFITICAGCRTGMGINMKKNLERQRQLRDQKRARLEKLMADVQALEQAVQEEENAAIIATVRKFELSPEELALALEELRRNVVAPSLEAKAKQDKEQMEEEETNEEAEFPQD